MLGICRYIECISSNIVLAVIRWNTISLLCKRCHVRLCTTAADAAIADPTQVESKKTSQIQWPVPSINAELVDAFIGRIKSETLANKT